MNDFIDNGEEIFSKKMIRRYLSFWPFILVSIFIFLIICFIVIRYSTVIYTTSAKIEILDKAQDSEMALPTAMTVFNRSMINLDNEVGRLQSYVINEQVCNNLNSNVKYFSKGLVNTLQRHKTEFLDDYELDFKIDTDTITSFSMYEIILTRQLMQINVYDDELNLISENKFNSYDTNKVNHDLPFELSVNDNVSILFEEKDEIIRQIHLYPSSKTIVEKMASLEFNRAVVTAKSVYDEQSDQIQITVKNNNKKIAQDYINELINVFDLDGIKDRQFEYKNTIEFVNIRSEILLKELQLIEEKKQNFKTDNSLSDLKYNADFTLNQQGIYNSQLFELESQNELLELFKVLVNNNDYSLLPVNFGLNDPALNQLIYQFNSVIINKEKLISAGAGPNNSLIINSNNQIDNLYLNIKASVEEYSNSMNIKIQNILDKEAEIDIVYNNLPKNEKILRSIERELEIKEALYLLLLQKKEEASINLAVVRPTIKIIDFSRSEDDPISPNKKMYFLIALIFGFSAPVTIISFHFYLDNKIHIKSDLDPIEVPVLAEIPQFDIDNFDLSSVSNSSRIPIVESFRMLTANLSYVKPETRSGTSILVTSSIKGEGKTLISTYLSKVLSFSNRVLLIGADLRNPQIHNYFNIQKHDSKKGLSDYLFSNLSIDDLIFKNDNLDVLFSGSIPPNPADLLQKEKFKELIDKSKDKYDFVVIDSAPCILVADTLQISSNFDLCLCTVRANHSTKDIISFLNENKNKFNNLNLVLNSVGRSGLYGYKYGYQYGYQYGYNYGYGYGYGQEKS